MNYSKFKIFFVILFLLSVNIYSYCEKKNTINDFLKTVVKAYSNDLIDKSFMNKLYIKFPFFKYNLNHSELSNSDNKCQKMLTVDLIYAKNKGNMIDSKIESIIIQFKEKRNFIKISELVKIFGKWVYRTKKTKKSSVSFIYNDEGCKEKVKLRCIDIYWKDLVQTILLDKVKSKK